MTTIRITVIFDWIIMTSLVFVLNTCPAASLPKLPKLLVVSFDAFRYNYFDRNVTPYLKELKTRGIYADYMISAFTTKTFPNHQTIATGMYIDKHGVVDNEYYDSNSNKMVKYSYELYHFNNETTPIWVLNEKAGCGRRSGVEMWPGGEFEYGGTNATFATKFNMKTLFTNRIDEVIAWFNHPKTPINFAMLYIDEPDYHGHNIGINNDRFNQILEKVDNATRYLYTKLKDSGLSDVNVIHVSDHGMASVPINRLLDLDNYVNPEDYIRAGRAPVISIFPLPGKKQSVYINLQKAAGETQAFDVYLKQDIPLRYHYSNNSRIGPILIVNKVGYAFQTPGDSYAWIEKNFNVTIDENSEFGFHGYDNLEPEMRSMFFGAGPAFLPECKIEPFNNVDLVPLFCDVLEIPQPRVNGTLDVFKKCLRKYRI